MNNKLLLILSNKKKPISCCLKLSKGTFTFLFTTRILSYWLKHLFPNWKKILCITLSVWEIFGFLRILGMNWASSGWPYTKENLRLWVNAKRKNRFVFSHGNKIKSSLPAM